MLYGLFLSANGAAAQSTRLDVIANNLANSQTAGFKRDVAILQANRPFDQEHGRHGHRPHQLNDHTGGVTLEAVEIDFSNGSLEQTGAMLDVALAGPGFLKTTDGKNQHLTRDGRLAITPNGQLVSRTTNEAILGTDGNPLFVSAEATEIGIGPDGTLSEIDVTGNSTPVGQIGLFEPRNHGSLSKIGYGRFVDAAPTPLAGPATRLHQGHLEASGTNSLSEMVQMIETTRAFETNVNMIQHQDHALGRLLQAVPR